MMDTFQAEAIRIALKKMFRPDAYFDICTVKECLKVAGIAAPEDEMSALKVLHCVSYSEMTPEMARQVIARTLALFSMPETDLQELAHPLIGGDPGVSVGLFRRLLGKGQVDA